MKQTNHDKALDEIIRNPQAHGIDPIMAIKEPILYADGIRRIDILFFEYGRKCTLVEYKATPKHIRTAREQLEGFETYTKSHDILYRNTRKLFVWDNGKGKKWVTYNKKIE
jgi:hypothetical protein